MYNLVLILVTILFGFIGGHLAIRLSSKIPSLIDLPNKRSSHTRATPRTGGIGILLFLVAIFFINSNVRVFAWLGMIIAIMGLTEDVKGLSPKIRLFGQLIIAICSVMIFLPKQHLFFIWAIFYVLLIVWTTNLYNFMDGIDGIAALTGIIAFGFLAYYTQYMKNTEGIQFICIGISGVCAGFLFLNFPKAKVFMGDVGSILLGFVFAIMVILLSQNFIDFICLSSFIFPFYIDEFLTMMIRLKNKENLMLPHRTHLYQLLANNYKIPHWKVSIIYGVFQILVIATALLTRNNNIVIISLILLYSIIFASIYFFFRKSDAYINA